MGIKISELPETSLAESTDVIIISGEETKRMTYANLIEQLKADLGIGSGGGSATVTTRTWKGLTLRIVSDGINVHVTLTGNANSSISTSGAWVTVGNFAAEGILPEEDVLGYQISSGTIFCRYKWTTDGTFQVGYARTTATGSATNISSGGVVDLVLSFSLK